MKTDDEQMQGAYLRDFLIAMYSHPAVVGVQLWGFWEGQIFDPVRALYRTDWTEKPNGAAWRELVTEQWRTRAAGRTVPMGIREIGGKGGENLVNWTEGLLSKDFWMLATSKVWHIAVIFAAAFLAMRGIRLLVTRIVAPLAAGRALQILDAPIQPDEVPML